MVRRVNCAKCVETVAETAAIFAALGAPRWWHVGCYSPAMNVRICVPVALLLVLAACAADPTDGTSDSDGDVQADELIAGRSVLPLSQEIRAAVKDAALRYGKHDTRVPRYGAPIFEPGNDAV